MRWHGPAQAATFPAIGAGNAYAAYVTVNSTLGVKVVAGPIAPAGLGCNTASATSTNRVLQIALGTALTSGTAVDTVTSTHSATNATVQSISTVQGLNALNGLVTASAVHAVANSAASGAGASSNGNGSSFLNLMILGIPVVANPAPNTNVTLPGIGTVVLNEQIVHNTATTTNITVNMIHVRVTLANGLGLPVGTNIIVGHAFSQMTRSVLPIKVSASAYGLFAKGYLNNLSFISGPYAPASVSCTAGSSSNRILGVSSPVGSTGLIVDTALTTDTVTGSSGQAQSDISTTNVLNGLIRADAIRSVSQVRLTSAGGARFGSTTLLNARIAGIPIIANPAPNTRINIAGVGYAIINEQVGSTSATSAQEAVNAIHVYVTLVNALHLPLGSTIIIGHSQAAATAF